MSRPLSWTLAAAVMAAAFLGASAADPCEKHRPTGDCTATTFDFQRVKEACEEKGRAGAASAMHAMTLRANHKKKANLACESCHAAPDAEDFTLKEGARRRAAKWFR